MDASTTVEQFIDIIAAKAQIGDENRQNLKIMCQGRMIHPQHDGGRRMRDICY